MGRVLRLTGPLRLFQRVSRGLQGFFGDVTESGLQALFGYFISLTGILLNSHEELNASLHLPARSPLYGVT